jgi:diguanylate cyclase (GGDEF)-like protein
VIESAAVDREPADIHGGLVLGPGRKNIEINFAGVSLIKSDQTRFRYRLEGYDADWVDAQTRRTAYYSYLPPGTYRFRVTAANSDDIWNEQGASLRVELQPFFYQTRLFYALCALATVGVVFGAWKTSLHRLESRERQLAMLVAEQTEALRNANEELLHLAHSDGLTGVANRRLVAEFLSAEWRRAIRVKTSISIVLLDLDYFKPFNDTYGHQAGDECLKAVAAALRETIRRPTDLVARFGGEEFVIILGGTDLAGAVNIAAQAMERVDGLRIPHRASQVADHVTVSIGVAATLPALGTSEAALIQAADQALYRAKANGRHRIES